MATSKASKAAREAERLDAIERLRATFPPGSKAYTMVVHVSQSGMTRDIRVLHNGPDGIDDVSWAVARAIGWPMRNGGVRVEGVGMDMAFHVVSTMAQTIHGDGYAVSKYTL